MFLTRVQLNPKRAKTRALIENRYVGHGLVEACTVGDERTLWRVGEVGRDRVELFMYTQVRPSVQPLVEQCGWPEQFDETVRTGDMDALLDGVRSGDTFRFSVQVSPQKRSGSVARALTNDGDVREWFVGREAGWGFSTGGDFRLPKVGREPYRKGKGKRVDFASAEVNGMLEVTDPDSFRAAVQGGLGRTKHAGFGMLLLAAP